MADGGWRMRIRMADADADKDADGDAVFLSKTAHFSHYCVLFITIFRGIFTTDFPSYSI